MEKDEYLITIPQAAKILGISRIAVYRKVKKGEIEAVRVGRNYVITRKRLAGPSGGELKEEQKRKISATVKRVVAEYGETLRLLGKE